MVSLCRLLSRQSCRRAICLAAAAAATIIPLSPIASPALAAAQPREREIRTVADPLDESTAAAVRPACRAAVDCDTPAAGVPPPMSVPRFQTDGAATRDSAAD